MGLESKESIAYADSDLTRSLDEAFAKGPPNRAKNRSATGSRPQADNTVNHHRPAVPDRGVARKRSERRASIAAAVTLVAHAAAPRVRRSSRTHEERLAAAAMMGDLGYSQSSSTTDKNNASQNDHSHGHSNTSASERQRERATAAAGQRHAATRNRNTRQVEKQEEEDEFDEDFSDAESEEFEAPAERPTKARGARRTTRRPSNDSDSNPEPPTPTRDRRARRNHSDPDCEYGDQADAARDAVRRSRFAGKPSSRSFDDSIGNMRARRNRRASLMGGSIVSESNVEDVQAAGLRARRARRVSAFGDAGGAERNGPVLPSQEPTARVVRETLSGRRARRATMATASSDSADDDYLGYEEPAGFEDFSGIDQSQGDQFVDHGRDERANKQNALLERLRKAKEEKLQIVDEPSLDGGIEKPPEPEPEEPKPRSRRRASLGIPAKFGLSSGNFASFEETDKKDRRADKGIPATAAKPEKTVKPEKTGKTPTRAKSTEGGVQAGPGGRARAADTDRRRRGTIMDRIGG
jgi:hypothetical protein